METHVNFWRLRGDEEFVRKAGENGRGVVQDLLEIGVMLDDCRSVAQIRIYVPQSITRDAVSDCAPQLANVMIAQGIFNEPLDVVISSRPDARYVDLAQRGVPFCRVYQFMTTTAGGAAGNGKVTIDEADLLITPYEDGTLLTITQRALAGAGTAAAPPIIPTYFRLRIRLPVDGESVFVRTIPTADRALQSGFTEVEYIDFRLNESRTLPDRVERQMRDEGAGVGVKLRLIAFLTAVPVNSELSTTNKPTHKLRLLEQQLWDQYVSSGIPAGMVVYHWKSEWNALAANRALLAAGGSLDPGRAVGLTDFSAFVKLQTRRSGPRIQRTYLLLVLTIGICGSIVASLIQWGVSKAWHAWQAGPPAASAATATSGRALGTTPATPGPKAKPVRSESSAEPFHPKVP